MLKNMDAETMKFLIRRENPGWTDEYIDRIAREYIDQMDDSLDEPLCVYAQTGRMTELRHGEFSLLIIRSLCKCGYVQAAAYLDEYIKDARAGKNRILRR